MTATHLPNALIAMILCLSPALVHAQDAASSQSKSLEEPIVVAPLDDNSSTEPVAIRIVDALRNNKKQTLTPPQVQDLLDRHKSSLNQVSTAKLSQDVEQLKEGAQLYFYEGPVEAKARIEKPLARALTDLPALAARKDLAEQTFEAAVILLRAHHDAGKTEEARAQATKMVTIFPSKNTSSKTTPPDIQELIDQARGELEKASTTLQIKPFRSQGSQHTCRYFINGFEASSAETYAVSDAQEYFLQMDCGKGASAIAWRHTPTQGQLNTVPIIDTEPLQMTMQDSSFQSRTEVEQRILFVLHWTQIKTFIGVSKNGAMGTDQAALLVHVSASDRQALWSDGASKESLCVTLEGWFPGLRVNCNQEEVATRPRRKWPLALAATGLAAAGVGGFIWRTNEQEIDRIRCSSYTQESKESCAGIDAYEPPELDGEDIGALISKRKQQRTIGMGVAGGGALLLVGGIATYFLQSTESSRASRDLTLDLIPTDKGAQGHVSFRF